MYLFLSIFHYKTHLLYLNIIQLLFLCLLSDIHSFLFNFIFFLVYFVILPYLCPRLLIFAVISYSTSDELIRQITINCAERGLLLLRVRDEARMTIAGTFVCAYVRRLQQRNPVLTLLLTSSSSPIWIFKIITIIIIIIMINMEMEFILLVQ